MLRFLRSRLVLIFSIALFSGFIIGYDYAVSTSLQAVDSPAKAPAHTAGELLDKTGSRASAAGAGKNAAGTAGKEPAAGHDAEAGPRPVAKDIGR